LDFAHKANLVRFLKIRKFSVTVLSPFVEKFSVQTRHLHYHGPILDASARLSVDYRNTRLLVRTAK